MLQILPDALGRGALAVFLGAAFALQSGNAQTHPCLPCHPREVERFSKSPMARSLSAPSNEPAGSFRHDPSGSRVRVFWNEGSMHHEIDERGLSANYPIEYAIGAGKVGQSYLIELGGHLFQSPAAYYTAHAEWNASPGYESDRVLDFSRPITSDCLFCHAGAVKREGQSVQLTPISCDRCHGPGEKHREHPVPGTIVNPAKLAIRARDSVCEQCHLEGATVVLNPGKYWWDFRPGEALEEVETHYVYRTHKDQQFSIAAVSQAEQLVLSACWRASAGKLWCGTCHDPHAEAVDRKQQMRQTCESCHPAAQLASTHPAGQEDCIACHMPSRRAVDVSHAAVTDHRIARRPGTITDAKTGRFLAVWHDSKPEFAERNLGLAFFNTARQKQSVEDFQQAFNLLSKLPAAQDDADVSAAKGYMLLGSGHATQAVECFERSVHYSPDKAEYWLDLGVAEDGAGNGAAAEQAFRRSIQDDSYDYRPYKALASLYKRTNRSEQAQSVVEDFLRLVPQSILMRLPR